MMKSPALFLFLFTTMSLFHAKATASEGFDVGNSATLTPVQGTAYADCHDLGGGISFSKMFTCRGWSFRPDTLSYFMGEPGIDADQVVLTVTHEDGGAAKEKQKFDAVSGKSKKPFSLWGGSLFNKALMKLGRNQVKFEYKKGEQVLKEGTFEFNVTEGNWMTCQSQFVMGTTHLSCMNASEICNRYFYSVENSCGY